MALACLHLQQEQPQAQQQALAPPQGQVAVRALRARAGVQGRQGSLPSRVLVEQTQGLQATQRLLVAVAQET